MVKWNLLSGSASVLLLLGIKTVYFRLSPLAGWLVLGKLFNFFVTYFSNREIGIITAAISEDYSDN